MLLLLEIGLIGWLTRPAPQDVGHPGTLGSHARNCSPPTKCRRLLPALWDQQARIATQIGSVKAARRAAQQLLGRFALRADDRTTLRSDSPVRNRGHCLCAECA